MALRYALLAALHEQRATGYELTQRFRASLGYVWNATHQQIYRELKRLHDDALLTVEVVAQAERPDRKCYQVTQAGSAALQEWLVTPQQRPATRDPFLVKLFAANLIDDATLADELADMRGQWQQQLATYRDIEATYFAASMGLSRHKRMQYLALKRGIQDMEAWLAWSEELLSELRMNAN